MSADLWSILHGDCLSVMKSMPSNSVQCVPTSPPYWSLRDYELEPTYWPAVSYKPMPIPELPALEIQAWRGCLGLEPTLEMYIGHLILVFREVKRILRPDGTVWLNLGDAYSQTTKWGGKSSGKNGTSQKGGYPRARRKVPVPDKNLLMIPHRVALAFQADGWYVRQDIVWDKPNGLPESVKDRPARFHEYVFLLAKSEDYYCDMDAIREPSRSGASDIKKMVEQKDRIGGKHKDSDDPRLKASSKTQTGRKRAVGTPGSRTRRSVWHIAPQPFKDAHFATFPVKLPTLCIQAGTSEKGCCPFCRTPWVRVVEKRFVLQPDVSEERGIKGADGQKPTYSPNRDGLPRGSTEVKTVGWQPGCDCGTETFGVDLSRPQAKRALELFRKHHLTPAHVAAIRACGITDTARSKKLRRGRNKANAPEMQRLAEEAKQALKGYYREFQHTAPQAIGWTAGCQCGPAEPIPCLVFDPFSGAATTLLAATRLGRRSIGIEANAEYIKLAEKRLRQDERQIVQEQGARTVEQAKKVATRFRESVQLTLEAAHVSS